MRKRPVCCTLSLEGNESQSESGDIGNSQREKGVEVRKESAKISTTTDLSTTHSKDVGSSAEVEGAVPMDAFGGFDAGLEAAFSRNKETLEQFSTSLHSAPPNPSDGVTSDIFDDEEDEDENGSKASEKDQTEMVHGREASSGILRGKRKVSYGDSTASKLTGERDRVSAESDDAVAAINEAKTKSKRGRKKLANSKTQGKKSSKSSKKKPESTMTQMEMLNSLEWSSEPRWFFLQVKPGFEQSCAISIRNMAQSLEALEVKEVLVPATKIMRLTKGGQSVKKEERIFPGYILVLMVMNQQNYADVQRVPNVQWFMGDPNRDKKTGQPFRPPLPVSDAEMKVVFEKVAEAGSAKPEKKTAIRPGDYIEVLSGTYAGNKGRVLAVKPDLHVISARLLMVGREAPVEFEMDQIKVVTDLPEEDNSTERLTKPQGTDLPSNLEAPLSDKYMKRRGNSFDSRGPKAEIASPADDLAALLADDPGEGDDEISSLFGLESQDSMSSTPRRGRSKTGGHQGGKRRRSKPSDNDLEFSSIFGDENDDFAFLDDRKHEAIHSKRKGSPTSRDIASADDKSFSSEKDLSSLLGDDGHSDLWDTADGKGSRSLTDPSEREKQDLSEFSDGKEDDLFAFLDSDPDDDFDEARVLPEVDV